MTIFSGPPETKQEQTGRMASEEVFGRFALMFGAAEGVSRRRCFYDGIFVLHVQVLAIPGPRAHTSDCAIQLPGHKSPNLRVKRSPPTANPIGKGGGLRPPPSPVGFAVGGGRFDPTH